MLEKLKLFIIPLLKLVFIIYQEMRCSLPESLSILRITISQNPHKRFLINSMPFNSSTYIHTQLISVLYNPTIEPYIDRKIESKLNNNDMNSKSIGIVIFYPLKFPYSISQNIEMRPTIGEKV